MHSGVQHILCCVFVLFLRLVYPMLPVSLYCPFLIAPSVFSNVYKNLLHNSLVSNSRLLNKSFHDMITTVKIQTEACLQKDIAIFYKTDKIYTIPDG